MYRLPPGVEETKVDQRSVLSTEQGGKIAIDPELLSLWEYAIDKDLPAILSDFHPQEFSQNEIRAGLSCLVEAGLLRREVNGSSEEVFEASGSLVSTIIVAHNSQEWLVDCIDSIVKQTYHPIEIILVDNASTDDTEIWTSTHYPQIKYHRLKNKISFAKAINFGVEQSEGEFALLLNPDTVLKTDAVSEMYRLAEENVDCAAVAAKLKFLWAPGFLNGLGNRVGAFSWGTDNGLGHLDLGQFDGWDELPSACFAAALISKRVWEKVGPADEKFPMYYEDSEWSYRARGLGYRIIAAPQAVVFHAFSGRIPVGEKNSLSPAKLENVVYGRLRYTTKLLDEYLGRFWLSYLIADLVNGIRFLVSLKFNLIPAMLSGWGRYVDDLPEIRRQRKAFISDKVVGDRSLFAIQREMPETIIWRGLPELTWDLIKNKYLPLLM